MNSDTDRDRMVETKRERVRQRERQNDRMKQREGNRRLVGSTKLSAFTQPPQPQVNEHKTYCFAQRKEPLTDSSSTNTATQSRVSLHIPRPHAGTKAGREERHKETKKKQRQAATSAESLCGRPEHCFRQLSRERGTADGDTHQPQRCAPHTAPASAAETPPSAPLPRS